MDHGEFETLMMLVQLNVRRKQIKERIAFLEAKNEEATCWGAAIGARGEEIQNLKRLLERMEG